MSKSVHTDFAIRFRHALDQAGYAGYQLKELAQLFNVSPQAVKKWLDGEAMPVSSRAPQIASALNVRRAWLLDNELPMHPVSVDLEETGNRYDTSKQNPSISRDEFKLISRYRNLPAELREQLLGLMEGMEKEFRKQAKSAQPKDSSTPKKRS